MKSDDTSPATVARYEAARLKLGLLEGATREEIVEAGATWAEARLVDERVDALADQFDDDTATMRPAAPGKGNGQGAALPTADARVVDVQGEPCIEFTILRKTKGILTKKIRRDGNGGIAKDAGACAMSTGSARRVRLGRLSELPLVLARLTHSEAIALGVSRDDDVRIVTSAKAKNTPGAIARTRDHFNWPSRGLALFDHDAAPGQPSISSPKAFATLLAEADPQWSRVGYVATCSTSSAVFDGARELVPANGWHIFPECSDPAALPEYMQILAKRLWLAGHGWIAISRAGALLIRQPIDVTVASPERLIFEAGAVCEDELTQRRPPPEYRAGQALDPHTLAALTPEEGAEYERLVTQAKAEVTSEAARLRGVYVEEEAAKLAAERGISNDDARRVVAARANGDLYGEDELMFDRRGRVSVAEVLADLNRFDGETLADPVESEYGGGRGKAKFFARGGEGEQRHRARVHSFAHGGRIYWLHSEATPEASVSALFDVISAASSRPLTASTANLISLDTVQPEAIDWLWEGRLAKGKLTLLAGPPGLGKSVLTVTIAAHITRGQPWPVTGEACSQGDVIMLSAEDDLADTIRPRLDAAGGDPGRVHVLQSVHVTEKGRPLDRMWTLTQDIEVLDAVLAERPEVQVVTIDPIAAYLGGTDSHRDADVRGVLAPLMAMAARRRVAVLIVAHLRKSAADDALTRVSGSIAFVAAARIGLAVTPDPEDEDRCLLLPSKNNIGPPTNGLAFRVVGSAGQPLITWDTEMISADVDALVGGSAKQTKPKRTQEAKRFLLDQLAGGAVPMKEIESAAEWEGLALPTVRRAKALLNVESVKGPAGGWVWTLPFEALL